MSRSSAGGAGVNLMPLLDVLLCTMGTLIIVLGIINREARLHPAKRLPGVASSKASNEELEGAREDLTFRIEGFTSAREKTLVDLDNARKRLAGIEDQSRQLGSRLQSLDEAEKELAMTSAASDSQRAQLRDELMKLNARRVQLDEELKKSRRQAANRQPVYAVVPFEGMYKTNRRPIYIECRGDAVILQPEGIVFTPADFLGPGGPSNPLAAALRAAQEYWRAAPRPSPSMPNEPYPLLLVRPDGIVAYYLVRDAMTTWDAEFGYELVGKDWKLDFPMQPESQLKEMETRAVAEARQRMQWLAQVSPELFARKPSKVQYHVSPFRGGTVRDGGPSLGNDPFADDPLGGFGHTANAGGITSGNPQRGNSGIGEFAGGSFTGGSPTGRGPNSGITGAEPIAGGSGGAAFGLADTRGNGGQSAASGFGLNGVGGSSAGPGGQYMVGGNGAAGSPWPGGDGSGSLAGGGAASGGTGTSDSASPGGQDGGMSGPALGSGRTGVAMGSGPSVDMVGPRYAQNGSGASMSGDGRSGQFGSAANSTSEYGYAALPGSTVGSAGTGATGSAASGSATGGRNSATGASGLGAASGATGSAGSNAAGGGDASSNVSSGQTSGGAEGDTNQASGQMPTMSFNISPQQPLQPSDNRQQERDRSSSRNLSQIRGHNWALPNMRNASVPIQRPIRVECFNDRLVLLPDTRDQQAEVIPLGERTDEAVDQLVAAVRTYTKSWGMAGRSMYWKPQLVLNVNANAESRAADLQTLLADSGWDVKRR